jgi:cysteine desulfuration protein SufE
MATTIDDIIENFDLLDEWDDRYRYLIELGRELEPLPEAAHNDDNKVRGCATQTWLALYSGHTAQEILKIDAQELFQKLGLDAHLTPQRSNGVRSMVERIKTDARAALATV